MVLRFIIPLIAVSSLYKITNIKHLFVSYVLEIYEVAILTAIRHRSTGVCFLWRIETGIYLTG